MTHEYEDVDEREASTATPGLSRTNLEEDKQDSFNVEVNQAYCVDINDIMKKLNKNLEAKV